MKPTAIVAGLAIAAAVFSATANAQTGRPSPLEVKAAADTPSTVVADEELGSFARYLMLNGATRERAVAAARNIDHTDGRTQYAVRTPVQADGNKQK